jgi:hypothetical protein
MDPILWGEVPRFPRYLVAGTPLSVGEVVRRARANSGATRGNLKSRRPSS